MNRTLTTTQPRLIVKALDKLSRMNGLTKSELMRLGFALIESYASATGVVSPHILKRARKNMNKILDGQQVKLGRPAKRK